MCFAAILGGTIIPLSSPCTMIIAPIMRVVVPHDVVYPNSCFPSLFKKEMFPDLAKFCPM